MQELKDSTIKVSIFEKASSLGFNEGSLGYTLLSNIFVPFSKLSSPHHVKIVKHKDTLFESRRVDIKEKVEKNELSLISTKEVRSAEDTSNESLL